MKKIKMLQAIAMAIHRIYTTVRIVRSFLHIFICVHIIVNEKKLILQNSVFFGIIATHHGITPDSGRLHAHHPRPRASRSISCFRQTLPVVRMAGGKSLLFSDVCKSASLRYRR